MLRHFSGLFMLSLPFLCTLLVLVRVFGHDVLEVTPQRFYRRELGADLGNFFEGTIELVDVLENEFEALYQRSVPWTIGSHSGVQRCV